jgi:hypothetical protein
VCSTTVTVPADWFVKNHANAQHFLFLFFTIEIDRRFPCAQAANLHAPIQYPKPDGQITFDVPTSLYRYACSKNEESLLSSPYLHLLTIALLFFGSGVRQMS